MVLVISEISWKLLWWFGEIHRAHIPGGVTMQEILKTVFKKTGFIFAIFTLVIVSTVLQAPEPLSAA
jgi:hypothetical protein